MTRDRPSGEPTTEASSDETTVDIDASTGPVEHGHSRRAFLTALGVAGATAGVVSWPTRAGEALETADIAGGETLIGLEFDDAERSLMLEDVNQLRDSYAALRQVSLDNAVPPATGFEPRRALSGSVVSTGEAPTAATTKIAPASDPETGSDDDLAFAPLHRQAALLRAGAITSVGLTELTLDRLERLGPHLECEITSTADRALEAAARADRELADGRDRGALHGIPWGAKDLLAVRGYPTTWGATPFRGQVIDENAAVVERLDAAGAVLVSKLTLGALAWGDVWFGGMTRNPWNLEQGSSGSSAGSASATAAGLSSFTIGSETLGSIVSPCTRCGTTGLRPTFGRVSRHGAMALSWTMDKLGPIARDVEDCALVFEHLAGADPRDPYSTGDAFRWDRDLDVTKLRVGVVRSAFDAERQDEAWRKHDLAVVETLEGIGCDLVDFELPISDLPLEALRLILTVEAGAAFDELTRDGRDDQLVRQVVNAWPNVFRQSRLIPAVEYVQANRVRTLMIQRLHAALADIDVYVCPSYMGGNLLLTNLTGHPAVVVPNGFRADGTPTSITFTGRLFGEGPVLSLARAYQQATDFHRRRPSLAIPSEPSADG